MVELVRQRYGVTDERILAAMRAIPRHLFLDEIADQDLVHDVDRAVPVTGFDPESITTTVSAPGLVAWMLELLELEPERRVLEIGTGSGYNAALLAELGCIVTTVDVDPTLIEPARRRLRAVGHGEVVVLERDGDEGAPERAPFDRVVATVGCNDISPAWLAQLAPDGFVLAPLRHGRHDPLVRVTADGYGRYLGMAGFVSVLGSQAGTVAAADDLSREDLRSLRCRFVPRGTGTGDWVIPRVHHDQIVIRPA